MNSKDRYGRTPLYEAAIYDHFRVAREFIQHGADVDARTVGGDLSSGEEWTPLHRAARHNSLRVAEELILNGANRNLEDPKGNKPIDYARDQDHYEMVALLQ